jgi:hypothetical protein
MVFGIIVAGFAGHVVSTIIGGAWWPNVRQNITSKEFGQKLANMLKSSYNNFGDRWRSIGINDNKAMNREIIELSKQYANPETLSNSKISPVFMKTVGVTPDIVDILAVYSFKKPCALCTLDDFIKFINTDEPSSNQIAIPNDDSYYCLVIEDGDMFVIYKRRFSDSSKYRPASLRCVENMVVYGLGYNLAIMMYLMEKLSVYNDIRVDIVYSLCLGYSLDSIEKFINKSLDEQRDSYNLENTFGKMSVKEIIFSIIIDINSYVSKWSYDDFTKVYKISIPSHKQVIQKTLPQVLPSNWEQNFVKQRDNTVKDNEKKSLLKQELEGKKQEQIDYDYELALKIAQEEKGKSSSYESKRREIIANISKDTSLSPEDIDVSIAIALSLLDTNDDKRSTSGPDSVNTRMMFGVLREHLSPIFRVFEMPQERQLQNAKSANDITNIVNSLDSNMYDNIDFALAELYDDMMYRLIELNSYRIIEAGGVIAGVGVGVSTQAKRMRGIMGSPFGFWVGRQQFG